MQENEGDHMYYIHKDYLGSFQSITNEDGELLERYAFDPWGRRRNPDNWTFDNVPGNYLFDRGYTGHEHLDEFGLVNMNGRVYDPYVARFLSPDPFVQNISSTQSFNRYSYVSNNPLKFVDPSGYQHGNHPMTAPITVNYEAYNILGSGYQGGLGPQNGNHWSNEFNSFGEVGDFFFMSPDGYDEIYGEGANDIGNHLISHESSKEQWGQGLISITDVRNDGGFEVFEPYESDWDGSENAGVNLIGGELTFISLSFFASSQGGGPGWEAYAGAAASVGSEMFYSKTYGTWMGKNFKMYKQTWGGNGFTGGKNKFGKSTSNSIKWAGRIVGLYSGYKTIDQRINGEIGTGWMLAELGTTGVSTFGGLYGAAWGVGWELGRVVTTLDAYQEFKFNFWYDCWESKVGPPSQSNEGAWYYFYNNYGQ